MTIATYTTPDNIFRIRVFASMYVDWGLEIQGNLGLEDDLYYSPSSLSNESYGHKPNPEKFEDWDEAENASLDGDEDAFVPWTEEDWKECLESEADTFIEAYVSPEMLKFIDDWTELHGEDFFLNSDRFSVLP